MSAGDLAYEDAELLQELLAATEDADEETRFDARAFRSMLNRGRALTDKQRSWVRDTHEKICGGAHYENLISSGKMRPELVEAGRRVPLPEVLRPENLPKKPPTRRPTE